MTAPARFATVGLSNALLSYLAFRAALELLPERGGRAAVAQALAYAAGILWSFFWNRRWTFGDRAPLARTFVAFAASQALLLVATASALGLAVDLLGAPPGASWLAVMSLATIVNYAAQRYLIFAAPGAALHPQRFAYSSTGGQRQTRLRSPHTLSMRDTEGQNFPSRTQGSGNAACSRV